MACDKISKVWEYQRTRGVVVVKSRCRIERGECHKLTLWRVSIPLVPKNDRKDISLSDIPLREELGETDDLSDVLPDKLSKKAIHIIVQCPPAHTRLLLFVTCCLHRRLLPKLETLIHLH